jgi:hypothetical protein
MYLCSKCHTPYSANDPRLIDGLACPCGNVMRAYMYTPQGKREPLIFIRDDEAGCIQLREPPWSAILPPPDTLHGFKPPQPKPHKGQAATMEQLDAVSNLYKAAKRERVPFWRTKPVPLDKLFGTNPLTPPPPVVLARAGYEAARHVGPVETPHPEYFWERGGGLAVVMLLALVAIVAVTLWETYS